MSGGPTSGRLGAARPDKAGGHAAGLEPALLERLYELMLTSRSFDEACTRLLAEGVSVPHYHSGVGQEALMVGSAAPLRSDDTYIYTHRGYGQLLAKGVPLREIALDLWLRDQGTNGGRGSVMHVNRPDLGLPGREGVFGSRFGLAVGLAMAHKLHGTDRIVVCCYGEAAGARGPLYEAMNMAVLWRLPVLFLAENNGWSFTTPTDWIFPNGRMTDVWRGFDIPVELIDGNDVETVYECVAGAVAQMRQSPGPRVIEGLTYRIDPHIWWDHADYQPPEQIDRWRERDPVATARRRLSEHGVPAGTLDAIGVRARSSVRDAIDEASPAGPHAGPRLESADG